MPCSSQAFITNMIPTLPDLFCTNESLCLSKHVHQSAEDPTDSTATAGRYMQAMATRFLNDVSN